MTSPGDLYVQRIGHGPDVVLVHGWGMHGGVWEDVVEALADDFRVTVPDLPGYGYSRDCATGHGLRELSEAVAAVAPPRAAWVGWSLGGLAALRLALDAPQRLERLVLVASSPCFVRRPGWPHAMELTTLHQFATALRQDFHNALSRFLALEVHGSDNATAVLRELRAIVFQHGEPAVGALADGLEILETEDLRAGLAAVRCPTLLLMGQRDRLVPAGCGPAMAALLPAARLHLFEGAGHAPFFSHPEAFVRHLREFLNA